MVRPYLIKHPKYPKYRPGFFLVLQWRSTPSRDIISNVVLNTPVPASKKNLKDVSTEMYIQACSSLYIHLVRDIWNLYIGF